MKSSLPLCSNPTAYGLLRKHVKSIDSPDSLLGAAVAISLHQLDPSDVKDSDKILQGYADTVRSHVKSDQPQAKLAHLHRLLFDELHFSGNQDDYYNPVNSYLPAVLETKCGLPIILSLIYKIVADRVGLKCWGVGLPGHFIVGVEIDDFPMLIDPFDGGREITSDEAHARMKQQFGEEAEWTDELLEPVTNLHWITRMLQNLVHIFAEKQKYADLAAMIELEMLLWPAQQHLQRDLGLVLARAGMSQPASTWLNQYLRNNPDDPQREELVQLLHALEV